MASIQGILLIIVSAASILYTSALYIKPEHFAPCIYTQIGPDVLDCSSKGLTDVPGVDPSMSVSAFYLDGNAITSIEANAFVNLTRTLQFLSIKSSVAMDRIDRAAFAGLTALTTLTVQGKEGSESTMNNVNIGALFSGLKSLATVSMTSVNIKELSSSFASGTSLTELSLVRTSIVTISSDAFFNATQLRVLKLSHNSFTSTGNMNWLKYSLNLQTGQFVNCKITAAYLGQIPSLPKLSKLDLSSNSLDSLQPNSLVNVAGSLQELIISSNSIPARSMQGLAALSVLKKLTIQTNDELSVIPPEVKQLPELELLDLRQTKISGIAADDFHPNSSLRTLKLDYTFVQSLHALAFKKLANLEEFTLSVAGLSSVIIQDTKGMQHPGNWSVILMKIPRLTTLSLSGTGIGSDGGGLTNDIWSSVRLLPSLRRLYLDYNSISSLPDFYLSSFVNLTYLSMKSNLIDRLTPATFYGAYDAQIVLQNNRLSTINSCTFAMIRNLTTVDLQGNAFTCDCAIKWLWLRISMDSPEALKKIHCSQPLKLTNRTWNTLNDSSFCSPDQQPPKNCTVILPTTTLAPYLLNITVTKSGPFSVHLEASVNKLSRIFYGYSVRYWPVSRPRTVQNTTILPMTTGTISLQISTNEAYKFCYTLISNNFSVEASYNCREFTLFGLASAAVIAIVVLAAIIGTAILFAVICLLCKKLCKRQTNDPSAEEDPYIYTYPDEKDISKQVSGSHKNQFQATLRPESKRYSKRKQTNLTGSRPSLATSTTTLAASRMSSPGFAIQNGARPVSGHSTVKQSYHKNPMLSGSSIIVQSSQSMHSVTETPSMDLTPQQISRSQDHLSDQTNYLRSGRMLPPPPRHARSQELVLEVTRITGPDGRYLQQNNQLSQPPLLPPPRQRFPMHQPQHESVAISTGISGFSESGYVPMSAAVGESSTDDFRQLPEVFTYNTYLPDEQLTCTETMRHPITAQQVINSNVRSSGGVDNSGFERNHASGYYEMGQF